MINVKRPRLFLSYARTDDVGFVRQLHNYLTDAGFDVWFDEANMPSRQLTFLQEIRDTIAACDRLVLIIGPGTINSRYVEQEWRFALHMGICINPIVRLNAEGLDGYELIPDELKLIHTEDFRNDSHFVYAIKKFIRQLEEPVAPSGQLFAVPELPVHYRIQRERLLELRNQILADVLQPVVVPGAAGKVAVKGMVSIPGKVCQVFRAKVYHLFRGKVCHLFQARFVVRT